MSEKVTFSYFYGNDADQYSFYRIPKLLFTSEHFKHLSSDAKILYGLMLDRMALSIKNHWFDEKNRAYIYFSMVKRYGGVPMLTEVPHLDSSDELLYPKRSSEKEVYDFVISETSEIADDLAAVTEFGRADKWAALSLKTRFTRAIACSKV